MPNGCEGRQRKTSGQASGTTISLQGTGAKNKCPGRVNVKYKRGYARPFRQMSQPIASLLEGSGIRHPTARAPDGSLDAVRSGWTDPIVYTLVLLIMSMPDRPVHEGPSEEVYPQCLAYSIVELGILPCSQTTPREIPADRCGPAIRN